jgi:hypothetical protein
MYVDDFICTYKQHEGENQENVYRTQFLQAFDLQTWDDTKVDERMSSLYETIKNLDDIVFIINAAKKSKELEMLILFSQADDATIFKMLFKFELFDMTHRCICDAIARQKVDDVHKQVLVDALASE